MKIILLTRSTYSTQVFFIILEEEPLPLFGLLPSFRVECHFFLNEFNVQVVGFNEGINLCFFFNFRLYCNFLAFTFVIIPAAIAFMTHTSCKSNYIRVGAFCRLCLSTRLTVTSLTHAFSVVLSLFMDAICYIELGSSFTPRFREKRQLYVVIIRSIRQAFQDSTSLHIGSSYTIGVLLKTKLWFPQLTFILINFIHRYNSFLNIL